MRIHTDKYSFIVNVLHICLQCAKSFFTRHYDDIREIPFGTVFVFRRPTQHLRRLTRDFTIAVFTKNKYGTCAISSYAQILLVPRGQRPCAILNENVIICRIVYFKYAERNARNVLVLQRRVCLFFFFYVCISENSTRKRVPVTVCFRYQLIEKLVRNFGRI